jgi:glycosyl transferase family 25
MKCYVINLDRSIDRFEHLSLQLSGLDAPIVRVAAIDGILLPQTEIIYWQSRCHIWTPMTAQEIGCFLSHRGAWKTISEDDTPWAFVCEDDIHIADSFGRFFSSASWIPEDAEIVKAETMRSRIEMSRKIAGAAFHHSLRRLHSEHTGSAGYFISRDATQKLLRLTEEFCEPVDRLLFSPDILDERLAIYQLDPAICIQDHRLAHEVAGIGFATEIPEKKFTDKRTKFVREVTRPIRQLTDLVCWLVPFLNLNHVYKKVPIIINSKNYC